jgi:hypothetical protein
MSYQYNYLLVDGVLRQDALKWLYGQDEQLDIVPLYIGTRWQETHDLGPILVKTQTGSRLINAVKADPALQACSSLLFSSVTIAAVAKHLSQFITVTDNSGSHSLFRFADPLITAYWLDSYTQDSYNALLGPVETWTVAITPPLWSKEQSVQWRHYQGTNEQIATVKKPNHLQDDQVAALEKAYRQRFKGRLYDWLINRENRFFEYFDDHAWNCWLERVLNSAHAWGLVSERSFAMWAEMRADWGEDFLVNPSSPYQRWLNDHPEQSRLAPEKRIDALSAYFQRT